MTTVEFLLARIGEDEGHANGTLQTLPFATKDARRMLRECEAKRRIVGLHGREDIPGGSGGCEICDYDSECGHSHGDPQGACATLGALAAIYADHPDYNPDWSWHD